MLLATLPTCYLHLPLIDTDWSTQNEINPDGQAKYVPHGLRIIESLLASRFSPQDIAVCYPDQLDRFEGEDTRVVGIHAHNPLGITFATDIYPAFFGRETEPVNATEFRKLILNPVLQQHKPHLKIIVGGPGSWQIDKKNLQEAWQIDCVVDGEGEDVAVSLFEAALRGEPLPRRVDTESPKLEKVPRIHHRSTFGTVEITRGCGRGCQFCSVALRGGNSIPLEQILHNVQVQVAEGADAVLFVTEDLFLYEQGPKFDTNIPALKRLFTAVAAVPGVKHIHLTHGTIAPVVRDPHMIEELSMAVDLSNDQHRASTHPEQRYQHMFISFETGSVRLFKQYMKGKAYPYRPEQWPDVILKGLEILNKHNWFPICTFILGLPGETREDTKESLDLLFALKDCKWCVIPTLFVPFENTRLENKAGARLGELTDMQWEFFFTCWRYNVDFWRGSKVKWKFNIGVPLYYYGLGRRLFGSGLKYPLFRLGHLPEWLLRRRLYLDFSDGHPPRYRVPEAVHVPPERMRPAIPELEGVTALPVQYADVLRPEPQEPS